MWVSGVSVLQMPDKNMFQCKVLYEDILYPPLFGRYELEESINIYLEQNYEKISVPVPHFGGSDPADIIHDFHRVRSRTCLLNHSRFIPLADPGCVLQGLTAYHDIALDKCYVIELNTTIVMPPRNLWELLINVKVTRLRYSGKLKCMQCE